MNVQIENKVIKLRRTSNLGIVLIVIGAIVALGVLFNILNNHFEWVMITLQN